MDDAHPIPAAVLDSFSSALSSSATPAAQTLPCGKPVPTPLATAVPCDLECMEVTVSTEGGTPASVFLPVVQGGMPRSETVDVVCGVRPFQNAGEGQGSDPKSMRLRRNPATIKVRSTYAASCGQHGHPSIRIEPAGGDEAICKPQTVAGSSASFEAFRLRTSVERSKLWIDGGPILGAVRLLWTFIEDDATASVTVSSTSCGIRASGACVQTLSTTVALHSEEELALVFKMPPLGGVSRKSEGKTKATSGESLVDDKGEKQAAKDGYTKSEVTRGQAALGYVETSESEFKGADGKPSKTSTRIDADWDQGDVSSAGYRDGGAWALKAEKKHSGALNYLTQRGFEFTLKHNGQEIGLDGIQKFAESCASILKAIDHFRELWEAGPGVKVAVGWSTSWQLQFLQIDCSAKWSRKVGKGGARLSRHREITASVAPVAGSATAAFGISVVVERLTLEWLAVDLKVSLTLKGSVKGSLSWQSEKKDDGRWSSAPARKSVGGVVGLTGMATGTVTMVGRKIGCVLAVDSGLVVEGELSTESAMSFQKGAINLKAVVVRISVFIGSTDEADYTYEQEVFAAMPVYTYPPAPAT